MSYKMLAEEVARELIYSHMDKLKDEGLSYEEIVDRLMDMRDDLIMEIYVLSGFHDLNKLNDMVESIILLE